LFFTCRGFRKGAILLLLPLNKTGYRAGLEYDKNGKLKKMIWENVAPANIADQL